MSGMLRSSRLPLFLLSGLICVWPTYAAPRRQVQRRLFAHPLSLRANQAGSLASLRPRPLSAAQIRAATTPPTGNQIRTIISTRAALKTTVVRASAALGLNGAKLLAPHSPVLRTAPIASQGLAYTPSPCDFGAGVWLTFAHPLAANAWPPTSWALLSVSGAYVFLYPNSGFQAPPLDTIEADLSGGPQITTVLPASNSGVYAQFRPDQAGLYAVTLNAADAFTAASFKTQSSSTSITAGAGPISSSPFGSAGLLSGTAVAGNKILAIVQVRQQDLAAGHFVMVVFRGPTDYFWAFGGVQITRLSN